MWKRIAVGLLVVAAAVSTVRLCYQIAKVQYNEGGGWMLLPEEASARTSDEAVVTQRMAVGAYDRIEVEGPFVVHVVPGGAADSVELRCPGEALPYLRVGVKRGKLMLGWDEKMPRRYWRRRIAVEAAVPDCGGRICAFDLSGAARVTVEEPQRTPRMEIDLSGASQLAVRAESESCLLELSGASKIEGSLTGACEIDLSGASSARLTLDAPACKAAATGASRLRFEGTVRKGEFLLSGASKLAAEEVTEAVVLASGASKAEIACSGALEAHASGASRIECSGSGTITSHTSGGGTVRRN